jgi:hypothetical protein
MKRLPPIIFALLLITLVSSNALAGHIAGGRAAGNIAGGRITGNIAGGRASGNIAGGRVVTLHQPSITNLEPPSGISTSASEVTFSGTFAGLIRMLLESGALL